MVITKSAISPPLVYRGTSYTRGDETASSQPSAIGLRYRGVRIDAPTRADETAGTHFFRRVSGVYRGVRHRIEVMSDGPASVDTPLTYRGTVHARSVSASAASSAVDAMGHIYRGVRYVAGDLVTDCLRITSPLRYRGSSHTPEEGAQSAPHPEGATIGGLIARIELSGEELPGDAPSLTSGRRGALEDA